MAEESRSHSHHHFHFGMLLLIVIVVFVGFKFVSRQDKWYSYVVESQSKVNLQKSLNSVEDAGMIAATIVSVPSETNSIVRQPKVLQSYVEALSRQTGRDIVVVDLQKKILADTIPTNVGKVYTEDKEDDVTQTIADGQARVFIEKGADYPGGINQTVISFKDARGSVVGAIIISDSNIFNK